MLKQETFKHQQGQKCASWCVTAWNKHFPGTSLCFLLQHWNYQSWKQTVFIFSVRRLTYDFHLVGGVDLSGSVGDVAGVLPAVLWRQVLQAQSPPLLLPFLSRRAAVLVRQRPTVLQPHDVGARVSARRALQTHRAADRPGDDALPHLRRLRETWTHCEWRSENSVTIRKSLKQSASRD